MNETIINPIPDGLCEDYLRALVGKFYKILPMYEECSPTIQKYIDSLLFEMMGNAKVMYSFGSDGRYVSLIGILGGLSDCSDNKVCKREVFKCIRLINEMLQKYERG